MCPPYALAQGAAADDIEFVASPFRYFLAPRCLSQGIERNLLAWFESEAPWRLVETDFYEQFEFSMLHVELPQSVEPLASSDNLSVLRRFMATVFDVVLDDRVTVLAHKLLPGQRIAIHNDFLGGENETHRLTVQLNRGLSDDDGGLFVLFNSLDPDDIHRVIRPVPGSCLGFEISENSNHAVSRLYRGQRYTLVYSFHAQRHMHSASGGAENRILSIERTMVPRNITGDRSTCLAGNRAPRIYTTELWNAPMVGERSESGPSYYGASRSQRFC